MNDTLTLTLPRDVARALHAALYTPTKDREDHTIYVVNLNLAAELRVLLSDALDGKATK